MPRPNTEAARLRAKQLRVANREKAKSIETELDKIAKELDAAFDSASNRIGVLASELSAIFYSQGSAKEEANPTAWNGLVHHWANDNMRREGTYSIHLIRTSIPAEAAGTREGGRTPGSAYIIDGDDDDYSSPPLEQLLSYCLEMISAQPHRRHTFGVLLCQWKLQLVLHSRSFVVASEAFDIRDTGSRVKLTVAIAALWTADLRRLGFDPNFVDTQGRVNVRLDGCLVTVKDQTFTIGKVLFRARSLFGRVTVSLAAKTPQGVLAVIKINSPPKSREVEADLLRRAENIPNVIRMVTSATWGSTLDEFGAEFVDALKQFEVREFRVLVLSPMCEPFTSIQEPEEFRKSFRKLVIAHHALFEIGILHCDISVGNMMYDPIGKEPYLIDVDLGKSVDKLDSPSSNHRTGTLPFMATDLLVDEPPAHLYRHDLESFYYVLIWTCSPEHRGWDTIHSIAAMRAQKSDFFATSVDVLISQMELHSMFESLRSTWIRNLHILFILGRMAALDASIRAKAINTDTLGGHVTFENFMEVLGD